MNTITVCKGCQERRQACWGEFSKYLEARAEFERKKADARKKEAADQTVRDLQFNSLARSKRRKKLP